MEVTLPVLETQRLTLRAMKPEDAPELHRLASAYEVALNTLRIPHPYPEGAAAGWIESNLKSFEEGRMVNLGIFLRAGDTLIGTIGLVLNRDHDRAELGYWIGVEYWNRGYATEAAAAIIDYGFRELELHRVDAGHFSRNPGSGRVMQKVGMKYEGRFRESTKKWDEFVDVDFYAILRSEWTAQTR